MSYLGRVHGRFVLSIGWFELSRVSRDPLNVFLFSRTSENVARLKIECGKFDKKEYFSQIISSGSRHSSPIQGGGQIKAILAQIYCGVPRDWYTTLEQRGSMLFPLQPSLSFAGLCNYMYKSHTQNVIGRRQWFLFQSSLITIGHFFFTPESLFSLYNFGFSLIHFQKQDFLWFATRVPEWVLLVSQGSGRD